MKKNQRLLTAGGRFLAVSLIVIAVFALAAGTDAQAPAVPAAAPDAATGLSVFADRCAICHGETGAGDGQMAVNLPAPPAALSDPEYRKTADPSVIYDTIFNGRFEVSMPPFGPGTDNTDPISEENIWNLVAAVYSLSTPGDSVAQGQVVYEENCLACHGEAGLGDGPDAPAAEGLDLTDPGYWFTRSNETAAADVSSSDIDGHGFSLEEDDLWAVVDYARTFSYGYLDPFAPLPPIEAGTISGEVRNGTTDEVLTDGVVRLRAFTTSFEPMLTLTTTLGTDGRYSFDVADVQPDWVYLVNTNYGEFSFSSDAGQLDAAEPNLDLPIAVYDESTDASGIVVEQMHVIIEFAGGNVEVSELYVIGNMTPSLFVGESGVVEEGTVRFSVPEGAQNIMFERTLGSFSSTIPASEVIQVGDEWADTLPLNPGSGGLNMIVRYNLPYEESAVLSHRMAYNTAHVSAIMPDAGVEVTEAGGWSFQGAQAMQGGGSFMMYSLTGVNAGETMTLELSGAIQASAGSTGAAPAPPRDQTSELLIGGGILLVVIAAGVYAVRTWQIGKSGDEADEEVESAGSQDHANQLLQSIVDLDRAYEAGEIAESDYKTRRSQLKAELKLLWE